jgi:Ni/Co efflux regulator RcnB
MKVRILLATTGLLFASGSTLAEKPSWAGNDKNEKHEKHGKKHDRDERRNERNDGGASLTFSLDARRIVSDYYGTHAKAGKCPPGLAKKNNGCLPPGQAKKWARGAALPAGLRYNDLPYDLLRRLPPPPPNHRYVQIAGDVLMIAIGTSMVVDAIEDILR